jgi:hypothetical protein
MQPRTHAVNLEKISDVPRCECSSDGPRPDGLPPSEVGQTESVRVSIGRFKQKV